MEGFTLVLLIAWFVLLGTFVVMYLLDRATNEAASRRPAEVEPRPSLRR